MSLPYYLFMAEQEGYIPISKDRKACLDVAVETFLEYARDNVNIDDGKIQDIIFDSCGIEPKSITVNEANYVKRQVKSHI